MKLRKYYLVAAVLAIILAAAGVTVKSYSREKRLEVSTDSTLQSSEILEEKVAEIPKHEYKGPEIVNYVVKPGDTLESIADSNGISVNSISESNNIKAGAILKEGQQLKFPSIDGVIHRVKSGETLWDISRVYSIEISVLQKVNFIDSSDKLQISQEIIIPGTSKVKEVIVEKPAVKKTETVAKKANTAVKSASAAKSQIKVASRGGKTTGLPGIIWPLKGTITSGFGTRGNEYHTGLDIAAPTGTPIKAALDGKVTFSGWKGNYGYLIILDHGDGVQTYYAHNSINLLKEGQAVDKGEVIAKVGSTGRSTGPHVHFEVRRNKEPYNPLLFLP